MELLRRNCPVCHSADIKYHSPYATKNHGGRVIYKLTGAYKNFLFENSPFCPSLQGETMGREGLRRVHTRLDLGARTWYRHAL